MFLKIFLFMGLIKVSIEFQPPWLFMGRPLSGFRQINIVVPIDVQEPQPFEQFLDHFNKNGTKWMQRFWKNEEYAEPDGPQFLVLGGDAPASPYDVFYEGYSHVQQAKALNATLWTLEHRFYGESQPFGNLETKNLKYLKSHQALADIANFIKSQNANLTNPKWIIFGGGYAGTLAIWFKELYPDLSVGIVASSAPIDLRLDFYDYIKFIEHVFQSHHTDCAKNFEIAFGDFEKRLFNGKNARITLSTSFGWKNPSLAEINMTYESVSFVYSNIISYFQAAVQYISTKTFRNKMDIASICNDMGNPYYNNQIDYHNLVSTIYNIQSNLPTSFSGTDISYGNFVSYLQDYNNTDIQQKSTRAWIWQVCNEFGSFLSTNGGRSIFGNHISYNFYIGLCVDVFGKKFTIINTQHGLQQIKNNYGFSSAYTGKNVIVAKNSYDPWSLLSLTKPNDPSIITYEIDGTGHCADMAPISDDDNQSLKDYRKLVFKTIKKWIGISK